jgi:RNA methyltransferase, TrmH family
VSLSTLTPTNSQIQHWKNLYIDKTYRDTTQEFIAEGCQILIDWYLKYEQNVWVTKLQSIVCTYEFYKNNIEFIAKLIKIGVAVYEATTGIFHKITAQKTPQGVMGIFTKPNVDVIKTGTQVVVMDKIQDPGNVGAILRACLAFGVQWVGYTTETADPYSPKVTRSSMGSNLYMSIQYYTDLKSCISNAAVRWVGTVLPNNSVLEYKNTIVLSEIAAYQHTIGWLFGNESMGLDKQILMNAGIYLTTIPMDFDHMESLNVGQAASICLWSRFMLQNR